MGLSPNNVITGDGEGLHMGPALLREHFLINPDSPLEEYDSPSAKAFVVEDRRDLGRALFALICTPGLPPRTDVMAVLKDDFIAGLMPLVEWGTLFWSPLGQICMAIVFERPLGGRVVTALAAGETSLNEYEIQARFIEPASAAISELSSRGVQHRSIRPMNLYYMDQKRTEIVLGECVSAPAGLDQPIAFETIEKAMSDPSGRGEGNTSDDIFSLGVAVVHLLLGKDPIAGMSNVQHFTARVEHGTYATLCGKARIPMPLIEPLRGMLSDSSQERWGAEQLSLWIDGKRQTPMQKGLSAIAKDPLKFTGKAYLSPRMLAWAFSKNTPEAAKTIRNGELEKWVRRCLADTDLGDAIAATVISSKALARTPQGADEFLVSRVILLLDPNGPIRYKGVALMPDGYGTFLAVEYLRQGNIQVAAEIISKDVYALWFAVQSEYDPMASSLDKTFTQLHGFLKINDYGYGIERCLYELNPSLPCRSPLVAEAYVENIDALLPALDEAANTVDTKTSPMDRHIAAFIISRFSDDVDPHLRALSSEKKETSLIGMLSLLAFLQWKLRTPSLLGLSSWVGGLLGPAINTYHNISTRKEIEREIPHLVRQGSLPELFDLIDNTEKRKQDADGYAVAQAEFAVAEAEIQEIENSDLARATTAERMGQQTAATTSIIMAMIAISLMFLVDII